VKRGIAKFKEKKNDYVNFYTSALGDGGQMNFYISKEQSSQCKL